MFSGNGISGNDYVNGLQKANSLTSSVIYLISTKYIYSYYEVLFLVVSRSSWTSIHLQRQIDQFEIICFNTIFGVVQNRSWSEIFFSWIVAHHRFQWIYAVSNLSNYINALDGAGYGYSRTRSTTPFIGSCALNRGVA